MSRNTPASRLVLLCGASILSLAFAAPSLAAAQDAAAQTGTRQEQPDEPKDDQTEVEEVVVTGIRASLASAQSIKRNSEQFVDSITAVDIGRLPDVNVAEALQRVSGIQITRNYGEGSGIAIRGLTNVRSELNGRDIFSASGGRGLSWEEVGSDLLAGVDVYKNPSAELIEGGLGGTINLRTRLPFDAPGRVLSASTSYTHYDLANDDGYSASFLASDRWTTAAGEFGAMLNMSYGETSFRRDKVVMEPYFVRTDVPGFVGQRIAVPNGGGFDVGFGDRKRVSTALALQWRPNDRVELYLQALRADYKFRDNGLSFFTNNGTTPIPLVSTATFTVEDGVATSGAFRNPVNNSVVYSTGRETDTTDISIGGKWQVTDKLQLTGDIQYIDSNVSQETINLTAGVQTSNTGVAALFPGNYTVGFDTRGEVPSLTDPSGYLANINNYGLTAVLPYRELNEAEGLTARADLRWNFDEGGFMRDIRMGVRATDRTAINRSTTYGTWTAIGSTCANWSSDAGCTLLREVPSTAALNPFTRTLLGGAGANTYGNVWLWGLNIASNPQAVFDFLKAPPINQTVAYRDFNAPNATLSNVSEDTYSTYAVGRFGSTIAGRRWDGNAGVRIVATRSSSDGFQTITYRDPAFVPGPNPNGGVLQPTTLTIRTPVVGENKYTFVLPSLNLRMFLTDELQLRFAASKNIARPNFSDLNATYNISPTYEAGSTSPQPIPGVPGTGTSTGNPLLKPQQVTALDASVEWYFSRVGYVYATAFTKDISDLFFTKTSLETYDLPGLGPVLFNVQRLSNVDEGKLEGFEIGGQRFFDFLPSPFDGIGIQANYTYIKSNAATVAANAQTGGDAISVPIPGLSKNSYNLILLYQKSGLNARLAYNWRDDYLQGTNNVGTGQLPIFGKAYGVLDGSISYDFSPALAITFDAQNILNQEFKTYQITEERYRDYQVDDRRFSVRLRFRY